MPYHVENLETDVLIVGTGPVGCTFARFLVPEGRRVLMIDAGAKYSSRPGAHLKNAFVFQRDLDRFTPIVQGMLHPLSVPPRGGHTTTLDPVAYQAAVRSIQKNQNPRQDEFKNLDGAATSYAVGGMFTHWTNNTPRHHPTMERIPFISETEWEELYSLAEEILCTSTHVFKDSIRHTVVKEALQAHYGVGVGVTELPVAAKRLLGNDEFLHYTGSDTVLGPLIDQQSKYTKEQFEILPEHCAEKLVVDGDRIEYAIVKDVMQGKTVRVYADLFVVAAGILTPQILWNSDIRPAALGRYLTEHPISFTQIVLSQKIMNTIRSDPRFADQVAKLRQGDPAEHGAFIPIPIEDLPPMVWIPVSEERPWHCQVHRDSFQYGGLPPDIDDRLVVDLRWFGMVDPNPDNRMTFEKDLFDTFGMPQVTFEYTLGDEDRRRAHEMMSDMVEAAQTLGGFLPGSEPRFMPSGSSLHLQGTYRIGKQPDDTCVTNSYSRVWDFPNLYLGGNGLIPTKAASNPSLTSVALAIRASSNILGKSGGVQQSPVRETS
jgi:pyranose oxidase